MSVNHGANLYDLSKKYGFSKDEFLDFSSNINPLGISNLAKKYIINNINMVSVYPDPDYINLKNSISSYCNCLPSNIVLGSRSCFSNKLCACSGPFDPAGYLRGCW